jgi:chalcone isomerase-like protein
VNLLGAGLVAVLALQQPPAIDEEVVEPRTGVHFTTRQADLSLLGVGVRTRSIFRVKVYAIGLYVADAALAGPLAVHKGKLDTPELYRDLVWGDFEKQINMKFVRDVTRAEVQEAFREALPRVNRARLDEFGSHFVDTRQGQEYVLRWAPGGVLETSFNGQPNTPIPDKDFTAAVFGIWLGERPIQADIKRDLVSRAPQLIH